MGEELNYDNILVDTDIDNLFTDVEEETKEESTTVDNKETEEITTEVNVENLFTDPESVGSEEIETEEKEDATLDKTGTSPNFYSSIATALKDEGVFPDLEDTRLNDVKDPESFKELIEAQIQAGLTEAQNRVNSALSLGIEPTAVQQYEGALSYLDSISEDSINDEGDGGENLRKKLIYQDFLNRGFTKERALRELDKSFKAGTDIDDAKEALISNKEFIQNQYNNIIKEAKDAEELEIKNHKEQAEKLKTSILKDKKVFGDIELDNSMRQKVYDNISKPAYKDPESGEYLTAIQKYEAENRTDFLKNVGLLYTLTDGFKNLDKLVNTKVKKEMKKGLKELEHTLNNTSRNSNGAINFVGDNSPESIFSNNMSLDI